MISDVLSEAAVEIRQYLDSENTKQCYTGSIRNEIESLLSAMDDVRKKLDSPPDQDLISQIRESFEFQEWLRRKGILHILRRKGLLHILRDRKGGDDNNA